ncbi:MAG: AraC family transcriptional regulator [Gammaproteobacteria bacterium]|nr:AraC family transcriptional regulator [Gammaproteobacteria bacterium]
MNDRLVFLLERFPLRAKVFHSGLLACAARYPASPVTGYIHVVRSGALTVVNGKRRHRVDTPSVFFYMNPQTHRLEPRSDDVQTVCASFEFGLGAGNPLQLALPDMVLLPLAELPGLSVLLQQLFFEAEESHCGRQAVLDRLMEVALVLVLRELMDQSRLDVGLLAGLADKRLAKALNAMHAEPAREWSLDSLAEVAGMSRARFAVKFREVVGTTPGGYLCDWRLGIAQTLLLRGLPMKNVAVEVGYGSASALARVFTGQFGQSPTAWLKAHRGE